MARNDSAALRGAAREDLRVVKTRRALRAALEDLMDEVEYSKITVTALAERACVNRKTFYAHYQSVEDLVAEVIACEIERVCRDAMAKLPEDAETELSKVGALTDSLLEAVDESFDKELSFLQGLGYLKLVEMILNPLEAITREARAEAGLKDRDGLRGELACYVGCLLAGYTQWRIDEGNGETLEDVAARVNRMTAGFLPEVLS